MYQLRLSILINLFWNGETQEKGVMSSDARKKEKREREKEGDRYREGGNE